MISFDNFIKNEREKRGWTQTDFGAKLSINSTKISRIENNKDLLNSAKLPKLANLFGIELDKLKELYFGDKFAKEAFKNGCPENTFLIAEKTVHYYQLKNTKQAKIEF